MVECSVQALIRNRKSVRTFEKSPLRAEDRNMLSEYLTTLSNPFGVPVEFRILDTESEGVSSKVIVGAGTWLGAKVDRVPNCEAALGYEFEKFVLYAQSLGIGTVWLAATIDRPAFERAMEVAEGQVMPAVTPLGYPANKKSVRETLMRRALKADERLPFHDLFFQGGFSSPLTPVVAGEFQTALEMVRLAPSAGNKQPWRVVMCNDIAHFYEKKTMSDNPLGDIQKVDIGIALAHFALVLEESGAEIRYFMEDPGLSVDEGLAYIVSCRVK